MSYVGIVENPFRILVKILCVVLRRHHKQQITANSSHHDRFDYVIHQR